MSFLTQLLQRPGGGPQEPQRLGVGLLLGHAAQSGHRRHPVLLQRAHRAADIPGPFDAEREQCGRDGDQEQSGPAHEYAEAGGDVQWRLLF